MGSAHKLWGDGARDRAEDVERAEIGSIEYRRTRVVQVAPAVLERNRLLSDPRSPMASAQNQRRCSSACEHGWQHRRREPGAKRLR
jgi:hypothetical protein